MDMSVAVTEKSPLLEESNKIVGLDQALDSAGVGFFHFLLVIVAGWALASDSVEVQCISFVTPQLTSADANPDKALRPTDVRKFLYRLLFIWAISWLCCSVVAWGGGGGGGLEHLVVGGD